MKPKKSKPAIEEPKLKGRRSNWPVWDAKKFILCPRCSAEPNHSCHTPKKVELLIPHFQRMLALWGVFKNYKPKRIKTVAEGLRK